MAYFRTGTNDFSSIKYTNLEAGNIKKGVSVTVKDPNDIILKSVTGTCAILPTNSVELVNTQNTVGGSYTTTRAYSFIVCAGSGSNNDNYTGLYPSFSCNGGSTMLNAARNGGYDNSITCGRLVVFKNVPSGSKITYTPGSNNSNTYIIHGIY